jgi:hypothetical protein
MNHPKVYDAKGRALEAGSRVERCLSDGRTGGIVGSVLGLTKLDVLVEWPDISRRFYKPVRHGALRRTYRCPDLLLITDTEKGDGDD